MFICVTVHSSSSWMSVLQIVKATHPDLSSYPLDTLAAAVGIVCGLACVVSGAPAGLSSGTAGPGRGGAGAALAYLLPLVVFVGLARTLVRL